MLENTGELVEKRRGIYQGSGISPILSNIYMMEFDQWLTGIGGYYVRYSDDTVVLGKSKEQMFEILREIKVRLQSIGLQVAEQSE